RPSQQDMPRSGPGLRRGLAEEVGPERGAIEVGVLSGSAVQPPRSVVRDVAVLAEPERDRRLDLRTLLPLVERRDRDAVGARGKRGMPDRVIGRAVPAWLHVRIANGAPRVVARPDRGCAEEAFRVCFVAEAT